MPLIPPPACPGRVPGRPLLIEHLELAIGVHTLPVAIVLVDGELTISGQALQWLLFQRRPIALDIVEDPRRHHEIAAVDPAVMDRRFLRESAHAIALDHELTEPCQRSHAGHDSRPPPPGWGVGETGGCYVRH